jgi:hypothetical protein
VSPSQWVAVDVNTIPATRARELRDAWEEFVDGRTENGAEGAGTPEVRGPIVDSWLRSREAGVDPSGRQAAPSVLERHGARERWNDHPLMVAAPLIERCLDEVTTGADQLVVISDADGMLLSVSGATTLCSRAADEMNFVEGALWSEAGAGTNAVGTALAAAHAVQVYAAEHFTAHVQRWTCAAAPITDPETGELLGVIDLTGDASSVHAHSLSVVVATARAVEELLHFGLRRRDDALLARHRDLLGPTSAGAALVTAAGRVVHDPRRHWPQAVADPIPSGGGLLLLPSGTEATAEPIDEDLFLVRPVRGGTRGAPAPRLELRLLGDEPPAVSLDGVSVHLRPRHVELLALLVERARRVSAEALCADLYGDDGHPASVRVEMSRLRRLLPGAIESDGYRVRCTVDSDVARVRALLSRGAPRDAVAAYAGPLLPGSSAPGIVRQRDELEAWVHQAVITSDDADALWGWVRSPAGENDLIAWRRLLAALEYTDGRRSLAVARIAALRLSFGAVADL